MRSLALHLVQALAQVLTPDLVQALAPALTLAPALALDLALDLVQALALAPTLALAQALALDLVVALAADLTLETNLVIAMFHGMAKDAHISPLNKTKTESESGARTDAHLLEVDMSVHTRLTEEPRRLIVKTKIGTPVTCSAMTYS